MMSIQVFFLTWWRGKLIGKDSFGNKYFEDRRGGLRPRRWVMYRGFAESSKVPSVWHGWLHHTIKFPPTKDGEGSGFGATCNTQTHTTRWMKPHLPNLSGTAFACKPIGFSAHKGMTHNTVPSYTPWNPNKDVR